MAGKKGLKKGGRSVSPVPPTVGPDTSGKVDVHKRTKVTGKKRTAQQSNARIESLKQHGIDHRTRWQDRARTTKKFLLTERTVFTRYRTATGAEKRTLSEQMGDLGGAEYLEKLLGRKLPVRAASTTETVSVEDGVGWDFILTFKGRGVVDMVHWNGTTMYVTENKGGKSMLGTCKKSYSLDTGKQIKMVAETSSKLNQGTLPYLLNTAFTMKNSSIADGRAIVGTALVAAINDGRIEYIPVSTSVVTRTDRESMEIDGDDSSSDSDDDPDGGRPVVGVMDPPDTTGVTWDTF